ncbi:hypothetical protein [Sphingomonas colocasiae]|uniref:DUF4376 domain-containing protein n=1 Tax=Sphingomonas colocasiae TaxID=1848973 RepID=A0ABS7PVW5_9SPHN|nr:hypothetical protein [Sphingomonas colocasiae]MBY8825506.1 hypothetical protein [Sphingomonas colocasiae]
MASNARTVISFGKYRAAHQPDQPMNPNAARFAGDTDQMVAEDGLESWVDGPVDDRLEEPAARPVFGGKPAGQHLWIVTADDVLHAPEACIFGQQRGAGFAKHSNLTGGGSAFVGGEVAVLDERTIAITGSSGRYRLRSAEELKAIEIAFAESGYNVWSMGYNQDTNRPNTFETDIDPEWISL